MANKKITLVALAKKMAAGFSKLSAAVETQGKDIKDLTESVAFVVKHMATKDDIASLRTELKGDIAALHTQVNSIERQLRDTHTEVRLGNLEEKVFGAPRR